MPNRLIKDSIHTSETVNAMTDFQFRLWVSLITYVDDYGRGDARPEVIKGTCFPFRERLTKKDINDALAGLAGIGCVGLYEVDGKPFLYFPNWEKHQRIQSKHSKYPAPPENGESRSFTVSHGEPRPEQELERELELEAKVELETETKYKGAERADMSPLDEAMAKFAKHRKALRKPLTPEARELTLKELEKLAPGDEATQIAIINQSIQRGWQGVFPLKEEKNRAEAPKETGNVFAKLAMEEGLL